MRAGLLGLLFAVGLGRGLCQQDAVFELDGRVRHLAVANSSVYVVTETRLYQLGLDLAPFQSQCLRGVLQKGDQIYNFTFNKVAQWEDGNATFAVNTLIPFPGNGTLIVCGVVECGYCELLNLTDISKPVYSEAVEVGSLVPNDASVGFLVNAVTHESSQWYILAAIQSNKTCFTREGSVLLQNTNDQQTGLIFSVSSQNTARPFIMIRPHRSVEFVHGFQIGATIYLFANVLEKRATARLVWLESRQSKVATLGSLRGVTLRCCAQDHKLLASAQVPGGSSVLWAGVFGTGGPSDTVLAIFDISPVRGGASDKDPDFYFTDKDLKGFIHTPLEAERVLLRRRFMTSVLAVRHKSWIVFFAGTGDGQVIKLPVDSAYRPMCTTVLYETELDWAVFHKMYLDPVDGKYVYVALEKQVRRIPVSDCNTHKSLQACWSAQDPYCGWCDSKQSCTFEEDCSDSLWLSIPEDSSQQKMVSYQIQQVGSGQLTLTMNTHLTVGTKEVLTSFTCEFSVSSDDLCDLGPTSKFPFCTCLFNSSKLPAEGLHVTVNITLGGVPLTEQLKLTNCSSIAGPPTYFLCQRCITAGCGWNNNMCSWTHTGLMNDSVCQTFGPGLETSMPEISSITPSVLSFHGKNHAVIKGRNLSPVTKVRLQRDMACSSKESPVWNNTGMSLMFNISSGDKGSVKVCLVLPDGSCHGNASISYRSSPTCLSIFPSTTWASGKRKTTITGTHLEFVEGLVHSHKPRQINYQINGNSTTLIFATSSADNSNNIFNSSVSLLVANKSLACSTPISYQPDPIFTSFTSTRTGNDLRITIEKTADKLGLTTRDLTVQGFQGEKSYKCIMEGIEKSNSTDAIICEIRNMPDAQIHSVKIHFGEETVVLRPPGDSHLLLLIVILLIPCIIVAGVFFYCRQQKKLTDQMNKRIEDLELDIRNDIRQGFVDMQTEKADLMENIGVIPFLDYKHFASRTFFPEGGSLMASCLMDISQDVVKVQQDERCQALSKLIHNQRFLTSMVHALEEQKNFTISDKCTVASLLTVALHGDLVYLTQVMEELLGALMEHPSNTQSKLMLRSTKSVVEKLLPNWMSICLYGFLRESVGQHLFLLVSALKQQIAKGPVDCVTEKALYTLSEDWLLWQAPDFTSLKLKVLFAVGSDGEVSEPLEVSALSCDTVEQLQEKILSTFKAKFGFSYNTRDIRLEFHRDGTFVPLEEVDRSSVVLGAATMLNTLKHYEVPDGASIKVLSKRTHPPLSPQGSMKDDQDFEVKYFHLIDPSVDEDQSKNLEKKKFKLKEVHLTKLLSTKVAVHSFVKNLFQAIWGTPHSRAPHAIKYLFDFLDTQAENMKLTDPDLIHIWKTNSLSLRFWVNILKNPQFVFDMEKTPHLDGCLSVIAQAFMDSFCLGEMQLGQYAPTNKLLYAKDVPQFRQEVRAYYKQVRDQPPISSSEFKEFLLEESKKHDNEFNESAALRELYKYIQRYYTEIQQKLDQDGAPAEMKEQLAYIKNLFDDMKSCSWN
ncbi:plexin-C1 [Lampris incognitus]|uniref:plexin-C1 n=1 Tax=Lampris incognitus TaxID=2546036 RepID=UPI0024B5A905|nr:plexin-C1 [Lampris incognitus]